MGASRTKSVDCYRVCVLLLLLAVSKSSSASFSCPKLNLEEVLLLQEDQCLHDDGGNPVYNSMASRVAEVNGTTLERALNILKTREDAYATVLFYADWCPFSRTLRPLLDTLSSTFPAIYHFAVEDSAVQPSALSQYGVHSFPVLFLHNKTAKVRYHGPRTAEAIGGFYKDITGIGPINQSKRDSDGIAFIENLTRGVVQRKVNCPYPWAKSPEKWLHDDMYLTLATVFLVMRVLINLMPRLLIRVKYYWVQKETSLEGHKGLLRRVLSREQELDISSSSKSFEGDERPKNGKGVLSVPGWSSSSLAAVTLAEGSSSRTGGIEDACENGHAFRSHLWG